MNNNKQIRENSNVRKRERSLKLGQNSNVFFFPSRKTRSFLTPPGLKTNKGNQREKKTGKRRRDILHSKIEKNVLAN